MYHIRTGKELIRIFQVEGWTLDRISGNHPIMVKEGQRAIPIPIHGNRDLPRSLEHAIVRQAGLKGK